MANITIPIADGNIGEVRNALCDYRGGYQQTVSDGTPTGTMPNPQSKAEMAAAVLKDIVRDILRDHRKAAAAKATAVPELDAL